MPAGCSHLKKCRWRRGERERWSEGGWRAMCVEEEGERWCKGKDKIGRRGWGGDEAEVMDSNEKK